MRNSKFRFRIGKPRLREPGLGYLGLLRLASYMYSYRGFRPFRFRFFPTG